MGVVAAVERDIAEIRKRDPALADSTLAATALVLAQELDDFDNSATSKSMIAKELRESMDRLRELAPKQKAKDQIDRVAEQRAKRRGKAAA